MIPETVKPYLHINTFCRDPADRTAIQDVIDEEIFFATNTEQVQAAFNRLDWNREQVDALQQEFMNGDAITFCNTQEVAIII